NLDRFLRETHTPAKVSAELADPGLLCAVVEHDGRIVSYAKALIHSTLPRHTPAQRPFELKQLYTDPAVIGRGAGALLMEWTLAQARAHGAD
ncbi:GNAT family N-acetyltransferase, partial [Acinetobacter baumannii]